MKALKATVGWTVLLLGVFLVGGFTCGSICYKIGYDHGWSDAHWELGGVAPRQPGDEIWKQRP